MKDGSEAWHHHLRLSPLGDIKESLWIQHSHSVFIRPEKTQFEPDPRPSTRVEKQKQTGDTRGVHVCMSDVPVLLPLCVDCMEGLSADKHVVLFMFLC